MAFVESIMVSKAGHGMNLKIDRFTGDPQSFSKLKAQLSGIIGGKVEVTPKSKEDMNWARSQQGRFASEKKELAHVDANDLLDAYYDERVIGVLRLSLKN